jgi:hypothetical protein
MAKDRSTFYFSHINSENKWEENKPFESFDPEERTFLKEAIQPGGSKWATLAGPLQEDEDLQIPAWSKIAKAPDSSGNPKDYNTASYNSYFSQFIGKEWDGDKIPSQEFILAATMAATDAGDEPRANKILEYYNSLENWVVEKDKSGDGAFMKALFDLLGAIINLPPEYLPAYLDPQVSEAWTWSAWYSRYGAFIKPQEQPMVVSFKGVLLYTYQNTDSARKSKDMAAQQRIEDLGDRPTGSLDNVAGLLAGSSHDVLTDKDADDLEDGDYLRQAALANGDDEFWNAQLRESTQCILRLNLGSYTANHEPTLSHYISPGASDSNPITDAERYDKSIYLAYNSDGTSINKMTYDPYSNSFMDIKTHEASQLTPMIRLYKTYFNEETNKIDKDVELYFDGGTGDSPFLSRSGVGIKSFDWQMNGTNPATVRNDITAKLVLYFQSFDDLLATHVGYDTISGKTHSFRYEDLLLRPPSKKAPPPKKPKKSKKKNRTLKQSDGRTKGSIDDDKLALSSPKKEKKAISDKNVYDPRFYEVKAVVGWAPNNKLEHTTKNLPLSIRNQQMSLFLTLIDHEFSFTQEGTFELTITYRARMEALTSDPRLDTLSTPEIKEKVNKTLAKIEDLKKTCGSESAQDAARSRIVEITEKSRDELSSAIINELQDKIYYTKIGSKTQFVEAIAGKNMQGNANFEEKGPADQIRISKEEVLATIRATQDNLKEEVKESLERRLVKTNPDDHPATKAEERRKKKEEEAGTPTPDETPDASTDELADNGFITDPNDPKAMYIPWFYFGDLINTVVKFAKQARDPDNQSQQLSLISGIELENLVFLFGDFIMTKKRDKAIIPAGSANGEITIAEGKKYGAEIVPAGGNTSSLIIKASSSDERVNLASVPVSLEVFNQWYIKRVVDPARQKYPLHLFLIDFLQDVVVPSLNKKCFDSARFRHAWIQSYDGAYYEIPKLILKTTSTSLPSLKPEGLDATTAKNYLGDNPLEYIRRYPLTDLGQPYDHLFPAAHLDFNRWLTEGNRSLVNRENVHEQTLKNSFHVSIFYLIDANAYKRLGPPVDKSMTREDRDALEGIFHLFLGRDRGLVKDVSFSKVDAPYLREARMQQDALNPLAQLAAVYNVDLTLFGNTIFWPGQMIYVNPVGLGSGLGNPSSPNTPANQLGLGGYHVITKVESFVESGKYETKIRALFEFSGDGVSPNPDVNSASDNNCSGNSGAATMDIPIPK